MVFQALPLIESLALRELADPRLEDLCSTSEMYHMARTAYACIQTEPEMRPSMAEVLIVLHHKSMQYTLFYRCSDGFLLM